MAHRSDRRGGDTDNSAGLRGRCQRLAPRARIFHDGPEPHAPPAEAEDTSAVRSMMPVLDATPSGHVVPRASRPCGRLRRCATRSLDTCSRRGISALMRQRQTFVALTRGFLRTLSFLLDGGVQIRVLAGRTAIHRFMQMSEVQEGGLNETSVSQRGLSVIDSVARGGRL